MASKQPVSVTHDQLYEKLVRARSQAASARTEVKYLKERSKELQELDELIVDLKESFTELRGLKEELAKASPNIDLSIRLEQAIDREVSRLIQEIGRLHPLLGEGFQPLKEAMEIITDALNAAKDEGDHLRKDVLALVDAQNKVLTDVQEGQVRVEKKVDSIDQTTQTIRQTTESIDRRLQAVPAPVAEAPPVQPEPRSAQSPKPQPKPEKEPVVKTGNQTALWVVVGAAIAIAIASIAPWNVWFSKEAQQTSVPPAIATKDQGRIIPREPLVFRDHPVPVVVQLGDDHPQLKDISQKIGAVTTAVEDTGKKIDTGVNKIVEAVKAIPVSQPVQLPPPPNSDASGTPVPNSTTEEVVPPWKKLGKERLTQAHALDCKPYNTDDTEEQAVRYLGNIVESQWRQILNECRNQSAGSGAPTPEEIQTLQGLASRYGH